ncbi:unnamed protein product [Lathyrus oleraceus]|uniref:ARID domain-containing protein n=1 Tax=Pisum sativum TaxID=3888 RepID=A0A9D4VHV6_PEA|nr:AT-rich interactive domain-containing protein 2 [Pisum sativum]KAI5383627.1 hypothetical protein KIW84_070850 [Pisum sativum]
MANGSSLDRVEAETFAEFRGNGGCLVEDRVDSADYDKAKQKSLFCQIFSVYLKEDRSGGNVRPVPVVLGDGRLVDLHQLFSLVKENGGYDVVSRKGLWDSVIVELGLEFHFLASIKLIYDKYLIGFEGWLTKTFDLEKEFRSLLCSNLKDKDDRFVPFKSSNIIKHIDLVNQKIDGSDDDDKMFSNAVKEEDACCMEISAEEFNSRKRKRESLSGMVHWTRNIAKHPFDPAAKPLPEPSKWKDYKGGQDFFLQLLKARNILSVKKHAEPNSGSSSQKVKMHPAMYEDPVAPGHQSSKRLRCSERLPISVKSRCSCCNSCPGNGNKCSLKKTTAKPDGVTEKKKSAAKPDVAKKKKSAAKPDVTEKKKSAAKSDVTEKEKSAAKPDVTEKKKSTAEPDVAVKEKSDPTSDDSREKSVSIGHRFQTEVPEWTGVASESDSKWLGTQVCPVQDDSKPTTETDLVGRGRRGKCSCNVQGSVDCVRFHIAENRMKLKLELGSVFYRWGFDRMGEEVSLRWTAEEEKKFKDAMGLNIPSQNKSFWNKPSKYFQKKTRKDMVNYYFNVYLIQLRSYQNRVTPDTVDSDDDEVEFGSFGDGFGRKAIKHPSVEFMECSENTQCFDFE